MKELEKKRKKVSDGLLSAAILARRRRPVASGTALDPLRRSMCMVTYRRTGPAKRPTSMVLFCFFLMHSNLPSVRGNTAQILARWRHPVASHEALDPLYWSILAVLCRRISSSVETARTEVHSFVVDDRAIDLNLAYLHSNT
jgi:hypothetical protein